jgi:hypothetical protein
MQYQLTSFFTINDTDDYDKNTNSYEETWHPLKYMLNNVIWIWSYKENTAFHMKRPVQ